MNRFKTIEVQLSSGHYQPEGCDTAFVTGISWDTEEHRPAIHLTYKNGEMDVVPLSELGANHVLGSVTILNN